MRTQLSMLAMAWVFLASTSIMMAQTDKSPGEGLCAVPGSTPGVMQICWSGKTGRTYFLQTNPTLSPLTWSYADMVETGASAVLSYSLVQSPSERMFVRLVYTDQPNGGNASTADFDEDGLANAQEVATGGPHSDPFVRDTDWDGYSDAVEALAGSGANNQQSSPNTTPPRGPLNPDAGYRYGLRLDYAQKYMSADYYGSLPEKGTASHRTAGSSHHSANPIQWIQPFSTVTTGDTTSDIISQFENAGFISPAYRLFNGSSAIWMDCNWSFSDYTHPTTKHRSISSETNRNMMEVTVAASPGAPGWARRSIVMLFYKDGWTANYITKAGRIMVSPQNLKVEEAIADHVKAGAGSGRVVISPKLESSAEDDDPSSHRTHWFQDLHAYLFDLDIEPDDNMAGVIGDVVPSKMPDSFVRHFVTPKLTTEIPATHVELKAGGVNAANFTTFFEWEGDGVQGSASNKYKVSRAATGDKAKIVKIKNKQTGTVVAEMHVWVVWCDLVPAPVAGTTAFLQSPEAARFNVASNAQYAWRFRFSIKPASIITDPERPDLEGTLPNAPQAAAPGASKAWPISPQDGNNNLLPGDSAQFKWDVSRQMKLTFQNPNLVNQADLAIPGANEVWTKNQNPPVAIHVAVDFPLEDAEGNDDPLNDANGNPILDEENDPYNDHTSIGVGRGHPVGQLSSVDVPRFSLPNAWGGAGRSFAKEADYREFARLHIWDGARQNDRFWFRVSDYYSWQHYMRGTWNEAAQEWQNSNSIPTPINQ